MDRCVLAFTDLYHPTVNGISHTVSLWKERWSDHHGRMPVIYPAAKGYRPARDEYPIRSIPAPVYTQYRLGIPVLPSHVPEPDIAHVHTPFTLGISGLEIGRSRSVPVVGSYHTLLSERARYLVSSDELGSGLQRLIRQYERWFYDAVDIVITPSSVTQTYLIEAVGLSTPVEVVSNGIDTSFFRPVDATPFLIDHGIDDTDRIIGYTGRHSPEKDLFDLLEAVDGTNITLLLAGDGPTRTYLERRAGDIDADIRFLGFLDYEDLPAFFSALDVFAFPSSTETQGLVALQAIACGTPVVAADAGALVETVEHDVTGYRYSPGDIKMFHTYLDRAVTDQSRFREQCLDHRESMAVERSLEQLAALYDRVERTT